MNHKTFCLSDRRMPRAAWDDLSGRGIIPLPLAPSPVLPQPVASHTDLLVFPLGKDLLACESALSGSPEVFARLSDAGFAVTATKDGGARYPADVGLCALALESQKLIVCRAAATDPLLLTMAERAGLRVLNVRQGYAKCSCAALGDGAVITADRGIAAALTAAGCDVLVIRPGFVSLPGYDTGFIGGASGLWQQDGTRTLVFCGALDAHPDGGAIRDFCARHGTDVLCLGDGPLFDVGSMFFLNC